MGLKFKVGDGDDTTKDYLRMVLLNSLLQMGRKDFSVDELESLTEGVAAGLRKANLLPKQEC